MAINTNKINISLVITIVTILLSVGGSWAVMKNKIEDIDKLKDKTETTDKKVAVLEVKLEGIDDNLKEQKANLKEVREDIKQVLRAVLK